MAYLDEAAMDKVCARKRVHVLSLIAVMPQNWSYGRHATEVVLESGMPHTGLTPVTRHRGGLTDTCRSAGLQSDMPCSGLTAVMPQRWSYIRLATKVVLQSVCQKESQKCKAYPPFWTSSGHATKRPYCWHATRVVLQTTCHTGGLTVRHAT
jgi:hypothetical protein